MADRFSGPPWSRRYLLKFNRPWDNPHYCNSGQLVNNLLQLAGSTPKLRAFAFGWASHYVGDSVAHPWVNGFIGAPFDLYRPSVALGHSKLEAWVNRRLMASLGGGSLSAFVNGVRIYFDDVDIQDLLVRAYEATYSTNRNCFLAPTYEPLTRVKVQESALDMMRYVIATRGGLANDLPASARPRERVESTVDQYLALTVSYTTAVWNQPSDLANFNLDQGVDARRLSLDDLYAADGNVFPTPGTSYVPGGFQPRFEDRCERQFRGDCSATGLLRPGGDQPDDNVSMGSAVSTFTSSLRDPVHAHRRLALKAGAIWPALEAAQETAADIALDRLSSGDEPGFEAAASAAQALFEQLSDQDPAFRALTSANEERDKRHLDEAAEIGVLSNGFHVLASQVVEKAEEPYVLVDAAQLSGRTKPPVLVVPTGGFQGLAQGDQFRSALESYVASGGTAVVFAQQRGSDFSVLPTPNGVPIHGYGWFEDNSCYTKGAYVDSFHPILASQSEPLVTSNLDGYFDSLPDNAIVLLRRVKNGYPSMFLYPYGQGWVIVSSSYDDWGGFNQAGPGARGIIRDAIAWAKKPADLPINLPGSSVTITLQIKNVTNIPATQAKLILLSPSRDRVIGEQTVPVSLGANSAAEIEFSHTFAGNAELGIYHVDYELLDAEGVTVQPPAEDDSGRERA